MQIRYKDLLLVIVLHGVLLSPQSATFAISYVKTTDFVRCSRLRPSESDVEEGYGGWKQSSGAIKN